MMACVDWKRESRVLDVLLPGVLRVPDVHRRRQTHPEAAEQICKALRDNELTNT